jgi:threonine aldolase
MADLDAQKIMDSCERFVMGHGRLTPRAALEALAGWVDPAASADRYGAGELIEGFEREVAALLGKEAAVFMPSGTMAQQIALRIWCDRAGSARVAFHPTCHLEIHELHAYRELHRLDAVLVGPEDGLITVEDFGRAGDGIAALLLELPQREIGGRLPAWDDLTALCALARSRGARLHLDGARLWECRPFYGREYAEIAALFDTVYVSFYKGLGGIAGAVLAGPADVIAEAQVWQRRHGGNLISLFPYVLSAKKGLEERLPRMGAYHEAAVGVAERLAAAPGVTLIPARPQTNMMHVVVDAPPARFLAAALEVSAETRVALVRSFPTPSPEGPSRFEFTAGDATLELGAEEAAALIARAVALARQTQSQ